MVWWYPTLVTSIHLHRYRAHIQSQDKFLIITYNYKKGLFNHNLSISLKMAGGEYIINTDRVTVYIQGAQPCTFYKYKLSTKFYTV